MNSAYIAKFSEEFAKMRERVTAELYAEGYTDDQIADILSVVMMFNQVFKVAELPKQSALKALDISKQIIEIMIASAKVASV